MYCIFRCCYCLFRQSDPYAERKVHSSCGLETGQCLGSDVCSAVSLCLSGRSLSCLRESGCIPKSTAQTRLSPTALLQLFSKHRPTDDSLCSVVMPHTPRQAPQISTSGWKLMSSFELVEHSQYFQWEKGLPEAHSPRKKSQILGCVVQNIDHPEHSRKSAILPKATVWFGLVTQLHLPTLQNGRIRTTLSCNQVPDRLPSFPIFLCYKLSYCKSSSTSCQKTFYYPKNSSGMCLFVAEIEMIKKCSWHREKEPIGKMRLLGNKIILWISSGLKTFRARKLMWTKFWSMQLSYSKKAAGPF